LILFGGSVFLLNFFYGGLPMLYLAIFFYLPLCWLWMRLIRADTIRDFSRLSSFCKVIMLLGIISMAFV
jgi:hypothetical protein